MSALGLGRAKDHPVAIDLLDYSGHCSGIGVIQVNHLRPWADLDVLRTIFLIQDIQEFLNSIKILIIGLND